MSLTNNYNISYPLAVWLASSDYDLEEQTEKTISATTLLKSTRQIILSSRASKEALLLGDISSLVQTSIGSAIHSAIEKALKEPEKACEALGIKVPKVSIHQEQRVNRELLGWTVTGKYDLESDDKEDTNFLYSAVAEFDIAGFVLPVVGVLFKILLVAKLLHKGCTRVSAEFSAKAILLVVGAYGYTERYRLLALIEFSHFSEYIL